MDHAFAQTSFFIGSTEFHWTRGGGPPVVLPRVQKQLSAGNFIPVSDSNRADFIIKIQCHSYYNGQTPYFYFALLDASLKVYSLKENKIIYSRDLHRIRGGGTALELADDRVYENASRIIADTLTRFMFDYTTGKPGPILKSYVKQIGEFPTYLQTVTTRMFLSLPMMHTARCRWPGAAPTPSITTTVTQGFSGSMSCVHWAFPLETLFYC
jgi:hypothetical protein